MKEKTRWKFQL